MEDTSSEITPVLVMCGACFKNANSTDAFCDSCGYPLHGSEADQKYFISVRNAKEIDLDDANKKIKRAGHTLYWIAGATVLSTLIFYFINHDIGMVIVNLILATIYFLLGVWSQKKPLAAIISGFSLYILIFILNAIDDPSKIATGLLLKILFITYFIRGVKSAIEAEKIKKELNY